MLKFNLKIAIRSIWKNKVYSSVNIIGLALSMACCLVISVFIWNELQHDAFHTNRDNIYRITKKQNQAGKLYDVALTPSLLAPALQKDFPEIVNTVRFNQWSGTLKNGINTIQEKKILITDNSVFSVFNFPLLKGDSKTALQSVDGLFGLAVFSAEQRIKEIGIRKVLGASVPHIVQLLSKDFIKLVIVSIVIASPIAYYAMHKWLQDFAYRINIEWWVFALAGFMALLIALLTVSFQAVKAAVANPVKSLRTE
jgi:hypothetical protein